MSGLPVFAAALSLAIGLALGMLGGGGAILTLPMLVYVAKVEPRTAIAMSLFVVGSTSLVGTMMHARAGAVQFRLGAVFGSAAMVGAYAGGRVARFVPAQALLVLFAIVMLVTAIAMLRPRAREQDAPRSLALGRALALGALVGAVSGLVGAGGGFLIVPALTLFGGLAMREAVGTSLFVIALQAFAGFVGQVAYVDVPGALTVVVTIAAVAGSGLGALAGKRVSPGGLRRAFAWLVLAMGLFVLGKQLPLGITVIATAVVSLAAFLVTRRKPRLTPE
jgi:hypothetical protein